MGSFLSGIIGLFFNALIGGFVNAFEKWQSHAATRSLGQEEIKRQHAEAALAAAKRARSDAQDISNLDTDALERELRSHMAGGKG